MDDIDRKICGIIQRDGRKSSAEIAEAVGLSVSTANERVRRLAASGTIAAWRGVLDPAHMGMGLCGFILIDMAFEGEEAAKALLREQPEIQELHHISGAHSYLAKVRLADTAAMQAFLQNVVKPIAAVLRTETVFVLETVKETTEMAIAPAPKA
ncbi:MAG: Lrp/AsnC family transcriptional regulator [Alphaproteobacteria bacterium]|nr:Lrp/AsnC family transcriptional regulator [Alphaproteobacteria bacterium]